MKKRLEKLAAMTPRELASRVQDRLRTETERIGFGMRYVRAPEGFLIAARERFYRSIADPCPEPSWVDRAVAQADAIRRHEVEILGFGRVDLGDEIHWHCDPVTSLAWERRFWADYDPVHDPHGRDSKIVHELNRHQHLPKLAKAYLWTGDERYAEEAVGQLLRWMAQNPPGVGINWQSSLEIAIRAISWMWAAFPLLGSRALSDPAAQLIVSARPTSFRTPLLQRLRAGQRARLAR